MIGRMTVARLPRTSSPDHAGVPARALASPSVVLFLALFASQAWGFSPEEAEAHLVALLDGD